MAEQGSETPTVEWGGRTPMLGSPGGSWSISTVLGGSSTAPHRQLSRDGACKDVTSQAHVKVAIYKQVIARVTTQLSPRQRRILLFISPPFARCSIACPCPQAEQQSCCLQRAPVCRGALGCCFPWREGSAAKGGFVHNSCTELHGSDLTHSYVPKWGFLWLCPRCPSTHTYLHKHHKYVTTYALFGLS